MRTCIRFLLAGWMALAIVAAAQEKKEPAGAAGVALVQVTVAVDSVRLTQAEPFFYCALEMKGSYDQHGSAFQNLYQQAGAQGLPMNAVSFGLYWNSPENTPVDSLKWELGFALPESRAVSAPLLLKKWEFQLTASIVFDGVYGSESQAASYKKLFGWIQANGYRPAGPFMEKFLTMPTQTASGGWSGKVEILTPVAKAK